MHTATIVVDRPRECRWPMIDGLRVVTMDDYASNARIVPPGSRVINLCRNGFYLSGGYYCSLLAEARGHSVLPSVATLASMNCRSLNGTALDRLTRVLTDLLEGGTFNLDLRRSLPVCFGRTAEPWAQRLASLAFELFPCPVLTIDFDSQTRRVKGVRPETGKIVDDNVVGLFRDALDDWLAAPMVPWSHRSDNARPHLAVLHDPDEPLPPSTPRTLERLRQVGGRMGMDVELIRHRDLDRLASFDALFIRESTGVRHPSFQFAAKAEALGLPVIDAPSSILRCGNKVFLAELLRCHGVPTPETVVTDGRDLHGIAGKLGYPVVLKRPDGCCGRDVLKAETPDDLDHAAPALLEASHLIVAQEYVYTAFDWRVTVLAGRPLFACRYRMAPGHWQIFHHHADGRADEGATECVPLDEVPKAVIATAMRAAALIGDGLYGVDLKETSGGVLVIEVNDSPNIEAGLEDAVQGDDLYRSILEEFLKRIRARRRGTVSATGAQPFTSGMPPLVRRDGFALDSHFRGSAWRHRTAALRHNRT